MDSKKQEYIKTIDLSLNKILDSFCEILAMLRNQRATKLDEMKALVFSKKRMCEITELFHKIFQNFVQLKILHRNKQLEPINIQFEDGIAGYLKTVQETFEFEEE